MKDEVKFWGKLSKVYNKMFSKTKSYKKMYELMKENLNKDMSVLELGTATGIIAREISSSVKEVHAIDYSEEMIKKAKELTNQTNISYYICNLRKLEFSEKEFDAVIISNVLHIIDKPEEALIEIKRVIKDDGIFIAPTFMWKEKTLFGRFEQFMMKFKKFPIHSWWNSEEFIKFLEDNGFSIMRRETIKDSFNICYVECRKKAL